MLSETLNDRLGAYQIGRKIRGLRSVKGMGLAQLGEHSGLSAGMLSRIERGHLFPTLPTLMRIALVFGVGLEHFFIDGAATPILEIVRRKDRLRLPNRPKGAATFYFESLDFPVADRQMEAYLAEFVPGSSPSPPHAHSGVEFIYVMTGRLGVDIHGTAHRLEEGDSMYFEADFEHSYIGLGGSLCSAIVTVCAPAG